MGWIKVQDQPFPMDKEILVKAYIIISNYGEKTKKPFVMVATVYEGINSLHFTYTTNNNTCGCCNYELDIIEWMEIPV